MRSRFCAAALLIATVLMGHSLAWSEDAKLAANQKNVDAELAALRAGSQAFVTAFNAGDAQAVAALWTEDGDFIDDDGNTYAGRKAIEEVYARYFAANPKVQLRLVIDSLRLLSDSAAIEDGRSMLAPLPAGSPSMGKYTVVHVKQNGKWLMATVRDAKLETPSTFGNVADLDWLIGTWTAEDRGAKTESTCQWIANKSFVERKYTITQADGSITSGVQLIGWNPLIEQVQSWNFTSDGGHAVGAWSPRAGGWSAELHGVTGEGIPTSAVNLLTKLDDNAYAWQSTQRTAGGRSLPDTSEVIHKRRAK